MFLVSVLERRAFRKRPHSARRFKRENCFVGSVSFSTISHKYIHILLYMYVCTQSYKVYEYIERQKEMPCISVLVRMTCLLKGTHFAQRFKSENSFAGTVSFAAFASQEADEKPDKSFAGKGRRFQSVLRQELSVSGNDNAER